MQKIVFFSLLVFVFLIPLPFASNRPWAWSFASLWIGLLAVLWVIDSLKSHKRYKKIPILLWLCFLLPLIWAVFQVFPGVPGAWVHTIWSMADQVLPEPTVATLSLATDNTFDAIMRVLAYGLAFFLSFQLCQDRKLAKILFQCLSVTGVVYALIGLVIYWGDFQMVLWYPKWASVDSLTSTFVNRNSFATYAGLTLFCACGMFLDKVFTHSHKRKPYRGWLKELESISIKSWQSLLAIMFIFTALILSHSRGGMLSVSIAALILILLLNKKNRHTNMRIAYASLAIFMVITMIYAMNYEALLYRMRNISSDAAIRLNLYLKVFDVAKDNLWLGYGLGAFGDVFAMYRDESIASNFRLAHNIYLELLFELGLPATILWLIAMSKIGIICLQGVFRRHRDWIYPLIGVAVTVLVAIHSLVDFSMQIPAVAFTYAIIMGAACVQSYSSKS